MFSHNVFTHLFIQVAFNLSKRDIDERLVECLAINLLL